MHFTSGCIRLPFKTCLKSAPSSCPLATAMTIFSSQDNSRDHPSDPEHPLFSLVISSPPCSQSQLFFTTFKRENVICDFKPCLRIKSLFLTTAREAPHCPASHFVRAIVLIPWHPASPRGSFRCLEDVEASPASGLMFLPQPLHQTGPFSPFKPQHNWRPPQLSPSQH